MIAIHDRLFAPEDRSQTGHWERDLIVGPKHQSTIATPVERQTWIVRLVRLTIAGSHTLLDALTERMSDLPPNLLRSITWDQGTEMARHTDITEALGVPVYFCESHSPWQRETNTNGLLRYYFPKEPISPYTVENTWRQSRTNLTTARE